MPDVNMNKARIKYNPISLSFHPPHFPPLVPIGLLSTSVTLFLPCKMVHLYHFSRFHIYELIYLFFSFWLTSLCMTVSRSIHIFHCIYVPPLLYPFICWWTFRLFPWTKPHYLLLTYVYTKILCENPSSYSNFIMSRT